MPGGLHAPIAVILSWPRPNYHDPETLGNGLLVSSLVLGITATILVAARLYTKAFVLRQPGADDVLVVVGLVFAILLSVSVIYPDQKGWIGRHIWDVPPNDGPALRFISWLSEWTVIISSSATKCSILLYYLRLAPPITHSLYSFRTLVFLGLLYNVLYALAFALVLLISCRPLHMYWDQYAISNYVKNQNYHCGNDAVSLPAAASLSVLGDVYATILPLFLLRGLHIPRRQKIALYALFGLGFLVVAAGIVRTVYIDHVESRTYDVTWVTWKTWLWTIIETYTALICACAPALKPLLTRHVPLPSLSARRASSVPSQYSNPFASASRKSSIGMRTSWASTARKSRASYLGSPATVVALANATANGRTPPLSPLNPTFQPPPAKSVDLLDYVGAWNPRSGPVSVRSMESARSGFSRAPSSLSYAPSRLSHASSSLYHALASGAPAEEAWPMDEWGTGLGQGRRGADEEEPGGIGQAL